MRTTPVSGGITPTGDNNKLNESKVHTSQVSNELLPKIGILGLFTLPPNKISKGKPDHTTRVAQTYFQKIP